MAQTDGVCQEEGCGKQRFRRGYCAMHYSRLRRHGDLDTVNKPGSPRSLGDCSVSGCDRPAIARDLCGRHYQRWSKFSDPLITKLDRDSTPEERFWSFVNKSGPVPAYRPDLGNCWIWTGGTTDGYGIFSLQGRSIRAPTLSWRLFAGAVPEGAELDHLCRVRACVRPEHLEAVSHRLNVHRGVSPWAICEHGSTGAFDRARGARICAQCARERREG